MIGSHYPVTYGHEWNWAILCGLSLAGAGIRTGLIYAVAAAQSLDFTGSSTDNCQPDFRDEACANCGF